MEFAPKNPKQSEEEFNALLSAMEQYNQQFSLGKMMASFLSDHVHQAIGTNVGDAEDIFKTSREHRRISEGSFLDNHANILNTMGLRIEPTEGKNATMFAGGEALGTGEMRLNIGDREKFLCFLRTLSPETGNDQSPFAPNLGKLIDVLQKQIEDHYDIDHPSDEAINMLASIDSIVTEYKRIGLGKNIDVLHSYLEKIRGGYFREYLLIRRNKIMVRPDEWGPAIWHKDNSAESLRTAWDKAIDILEKVQKNPRASRLAKELQEHLIMCAHHSIQHLKDNPDCYQNTSIQWKDMQEVVTDALERL